MSYYDRWNDTNRDAHRQGERDASYGYRAHRNDFDSHGEPREAYEDGYREERGRIERREEERQYEERQERERLERQRSQELYNEEEYYRLQQEQEEPESQIALCSYPEEAKEVPSEES